MKSDGKESGKENRSSKKIGAEESDKETGAKETSKKSGKRAKSGEEQKSGEEKHNTEKDAGMNENEDNANDGMFFYFIFSFLKDWVI